MLPARIVSAREQFARATEACLPGSTELGNRLVYALLAQQGNAQAVTDRFDALVLGLHRASIRSLRHAEVVQMVPLVIAEPADYPEVVRIKGDVFLRFAEISSGCTV